MTAHAVRARVPKLLFLFVVVEVLLVGMGASAQAHAIVTSTSPAIDETVQKSPERVVMKFNEPVEVSFGAIRVYDTDGDRVDVGETQHIEGHADEIGVRLEGDLPKGTYTATWRVISADGHAISEAFVFHVKEPGQHPEGIASRLLNNDDDQGLAAALFTATRMFNFTAMLILGGGIVFLVGIWLRVLPEPRSPEVESRFSHRVRRLLVGAWTALLIGTIAGVVLQGAVAGGVSLASATTPSVVEAIVATRFGVVSVFRLGALVLVAVIGSAMWRRLRATASASSVGAASARPGFAWWQLMLVGVLVTFVLASPGLSGHAGTTSPIAVNVLADVIHLWAAAAWIGGLTVLLVAAFPAVRAGDDRDGAAAIAPVVARFSDFALIAVTVVVVTGTYRSWVEVGAIRALTGATYGWVLLAKIGVFVPLVALGAINNRWTKPRLEKASRGDGDARRPLTILRRLVLIEVALALVVIGVTSLLVNLPPARVEAGVTGPFITDTALGDYRLNVLVEPNRVGENQVHLTATEQSGSPAPVKQMEVLFRMPAEEIGPLHGKAKRLAQGHYVVQGRQLSVPGQWQIEVIARTGPFDEIRTTVSLDVNE
jgi:copper transport protein